MTAADLSALHRTLCRQIAQHIVRGVPAECLEDLYLRLDAVEAELAIVATTVLIRSTTPGEC